MENKLEITVQKTIEALARIQRFIDKYGLELSREHKERITKKIVELEKSLSN